MDITTIEKPVSAEWDAGYAMHDFVAQLLSLHRSITGDGIRQTMRLIAEQIPLEIVEVPSGTRAFDWTVPAEWNLRDAWIKDSNGERVVDFQKSNLHIVAYSAPFHGRMSWEQLKPHLHTLPQHPDWIPYRTAYYEDTWGFCISHALYEQFERCPNEPYEVFIDSTLQAGSLTYGESVLRGATNDCVLIWAHACHPALANDNLSGIAVATWLAKHVRSRERRYTYRFVFAPATIGAIVWLAKNEKKAHTIKHGLILTVVGDAGSSTYKRSRRGNAEIDRIVEYVLQTSNSSFDIRNFTPIGYDERQFCSPGFDLPVGCLMRTPNGEYPEYHTSADNLDIIQPQSLADSLRKCTSIIDIIEQNRVYRNLKPKCEPRLGRHDLYRAFEHARDAADLQQALQWVLNYSDCENSLLEIADRSGLSFPLLVQAAEKLVACGLILPVDERAQESIAESS